MSIEQKQQELIDHFGYFSEWMDRYEEIIRIGKELAPLDPKYKVDENLIRGCQSRVWLNAYAHEGRIYFEADSDALITKGLVGMMVQVLSGQRADDILQADIHFIHDIGLIHHLSPTRSNGLLAMIKQMKHYALAIRAKHETGHS